MCINIIIHVDIYSFGMCVLEISSNQYPYSECENAVQIWKTACAGTKPLALAKIKNIQLRTFIESCLDSQEKRLTAEQLLQHPFLSYKNTNPADFSEQIISNPEPVTSTIELSASFINTETLSFSVKLGTKNIQFNYILLTDNPTAVTIEMLNLFPLQSVEEFVHIISTKIQDEITRLLDSNVNSKEIPIMSLQHALIVKQEFLKNRDTREQVREERIREIQEDAQRTEARLLGNLRNLRFL
jgi:serine/threonine protein kinase